MFPHQRAWLDRNHTLSRSHNAITVGEPNWAPLEATIPAMELEDFMYMGRAGEIELYKHRLTRRYLNIGRDSQSFYQYVNGEYVEITREAALEYVFRYKKEQLHVKRSE